MSLGRGFGSSVGFLADLRRVEPGGVERCNFESAAHEPPTLSTFDRPRSAGSKPSLEGRSSNLTGTMPETSTLTTLKLRRGACLPSGNCGPQ